MATRIYEFSKQSGIPSKELITILQDAGFDVASHMSVLSDEALSYLQKNIKNQKKDTKPEVLKKQEPVAPKAVEKPVIIQEQAAVEAGQKEQDKARGRVRVKPQKADKSEAKKEEAPEEFGVRLESMMVGDFAAKAQKPVSEVILDLLRQGTMVTKNQIISPAIVEKLANLYEIPILAAEIESKEEVAYAGELKEEREPIVVVIGHVDHGKTTLLDFIRKTRVAEREKGGITQHLGAYRVKAPSGMVVFLDTPGHEAFSLMRARGVKVADLAVLVVAADDSVKPQTIEAIKHARSVNVPIIVAINKIDKASPAQVEKVKQDLVQHGVVPEEWGGQAVIVPISAKVGTGVDELLEMIVLQAQLLELQTDSTIPARGYVLESKIQKGFGPVATVICHFGTLKIGDSFKAGSVFGKVSSLVDSAGKKINKAAPSMPVQVAGFSALPQAGDLFMVVSAEEVKKAKRAQTTHAASSQPQSFTAEGAQVIRLVVKADNASSLEALEVGINKIAQRLPEDQSVVIVHRGVGDISESDVLLARDTGSLIYGFGVKAEAKASALATREKVSIGLFGIIYKLFEDIEAFAEKSKIIKMVSKETGVAEVLKVFKVKGLGVIAGARVTSGSFVRNGSVEAYRNGKKIGGGPIKSLQRDKQSVKEVNTGYECAFLIDGFGDWEPGDKVKCFIQVPEE